MMDQSETRGWRESAWNRQPAATCAMGRNRLALETGSARAAANTKSSRVPRGAEAGEPLRFMAAAWMAPVQRRYSSGSQWLIRVLEWMTAKAWPLAVLDDMCTWFEEGSAASRMFVGCAAAATMAALLTMHATALYGLQAMTLLPAFGGHGVLVVVAASFLLGATLLPAVLGHVVSVLLRFYVLLNLCTMAALVGYGSWLLYSYAKF